MEPLRVGLFTEIYRPVVNGVVASVEALADGLRARGHQVYCFAPEMPATTSRGPRVSHTLTSPARRGRRTG